MDELVMPKNRCIQCILHPLHVAQNHPQIKVFGYEIPFDGDEAGLEEPE